MPPINPHTSYNMEACHSCSRCFSSDLMPTFLARGVWWSFFYYLGTRNKFRSRFCASLLLLVFWSGCLVFMTDTFILLLFAYILKPFSSTPPLPSHHSSMSAFLWIIPTLYRIYQTNRKTTMTDTTTYMIYSIIIGVTTTLITFLLTGSKSA